MSEVRVPGPSGPRGRGEATVFATNKVGRAPYGSVSSSAPEVTVGERTPGLPVTPIPDTVEVA